MRNILKNLRPRTYADSVLITVLIGVPAVTLLGSLFFHDHSHSGGVATVATSTAPNPYNSVKITASSAIVYDAVTGETLYAKNAQTPLPLASITKIMTSLVALEQAPKSTQLTFDEVSLQEEGDSGLMAGERWNLLSLIEFTLVSSSNDGARAVASAIQALKPEKNFIARMNEEATRLGLTSMRFENPTGLDLNESQAGAYGSAEDVAKLFSYTIKNHPEIFETTKSDHITVSSDTGSHFALNTNVVAGKLPGLIGSKTGYSDLAGGNLAVILNMGVNHPIVIVALGSTYEDRFSDIQKLAGTTVTYSALENGL